MNRMLCFLAALLVSGCAAFDGRGLMPGKASAAEVRALMGVPAQELKAPDGGTLLYFTRYPYGRATYVASIGPDDRLRGIEQRLNYWAIHKVKQGMRTDEVRELLGPPREISRLSRKQRDVWEYPWRHAARELRILWVQFSDDGIAREVIEMHDYEAEPENSKD